MLYGLVIGYCGFILLGLYWKVHLRDLLRASLNGIRESLIVAQILCVIGILTAMWRMNGTIACFTYYGIKIIPPKIFLLASFIIASIVSYVSYAIGTSLGVGSTVGIILMGIARSGGLKELIAAGSILSGIYFGDRCSPVGSSANLVAEITNTDLYGNVKPMLKTSLLPIGLCILVFGNCSLFYPLKQHDSTVI